MKTVIIPDLHYKIDRADRIVNAESPDIVVCSGDFFDPKGGWDTGVEESIKTALWLKSKMEDPRFKFIEGNHDAPYKRGESDYIRCSGYDIDKAHEINKILNKSHWDRLVRYHWVDNYLVSHAGVSAQHVPKNWAINGVTKEEFTKWLDAQIAESEEAWKAGKPHWVFGAGRSRGGWQPIGGMNWCDFNAEFQPITGIEQIVGHTADTHVRRTSNGDICLDTVLRHYAVYMNGSLEIKEYANL